MGLPQRPGPEGRPGRPRRDRQTHPRPPSPDQRQGRTLQPHAPGRMGLPAALHLQRRTKRSPGRLPPHLQPPPLPHRTRRTPAHHPRQQPCGWVCKENVLQSRARQSVRYPMGSQSTVDPGWRMVAGDEREFQGFGPVARARRPARSSMAIGHRTCRRVRCTGGAGSATWAPQSRTPPLGSGLQDTSGSRRRIPVREGASQLPHGPTQLPGRAGDTAGSASPAPTCDSTGPAPAPVGEPHTVRGPSRNLRGSRKLCSRAAITTSVSALAT